MDDKLKLKVEFGGGCELLFNKQKLIELELENLDDVKQKWTIGELIKLLSEKYIQERVELFASGDKIRPGILILVNDVDYEILGGDKYELNNGDSVLFISTLHGG